MIFDLLVMGFFFWNYETLSAMKKKKREKKIVVSPCYGYAIWPISLSCARDNSSYGAKQE